MTRPAGRQEIRDLLHDVAEQLRSHRTLGVTDLKAGGAMPGVATGRGLDGIRAELGDCTRCPLCQHRTRIVFGAGSARAELVFVGEGPGRDEDQQGEPFVGRAGQLLTKMIEAIGLTRDRVYIANVVKCRPPENRTPTPEEIATCLPFLEAQLAVIRPRVICTLGATATQALLQTSDKISHLRGRFHDYQMSGRIMKVMPTYHPAYLLRNPHEKKTVWNDLQVIQREINPHPTP